MDTHKFYTNESLWLSYIFKNTKRLDRAIEFKIDRDLLTFSRLCLLNRLLMNRYLDVVYETFCLEIHSEVINRLNVIRCESSNIKRDKSEKIITISVGFKQNRQSNNDDDDDMFYTLELLK